MSPVDRVRAALQVLGLGDVVLELNDSARTAPMAAEAIGAHFGVHVPVGAIVKSLLFVVNAQPLIVLAAGDRNVNHKRLGALYNVSGKKVKLADPATVIRVTGFEVGGVPPVGHTQRLPVLIDESLSRFSTVWAAAGAHHAVFPIEYTRLIEITAGQVVTLTVPPNEPGAAV
jgi:prolyl-tRNA editing enzyme YbaK/EbsC (Cys-tRNA(Pro) deacylase)